MSEPVTKSLALVLGLALAGGALAGAPTSKGGCPGDGEESFHHGDTTCKDGTGWKCSAGRWVKEGACDGGDGSSTVEPGQEAETGEDPVPVDPAGATDDPGAQDPADATEGTVTPEPGPAADGDDGAAGDEDMEEGDAGDEDPEGSEEEGEYRDEYDDEADAEAGSTSEAPAPEDGSGEP